MTISAKWYIGFKRTITDALQKRGTNIRMREQIGACLSEAGYKKLPTNKPEFTIYYEERGSSINAIHLCDLAGNHDIMSETFAHIKEKVTWRFMDMGFEDVHVMDVILTDDVNDAKNLIKTERFAWIVDKQTKQLIIYEDKAEDFYGLKSLLEQALSESEQTEEISQYPEQSGYIRTQNTSYKKQNRSIINLAIVIFNLLLFMICTLSGEVLYNIGDMNPGKIIEYGQWYRMITSMFLHADVDHIASNMILLLFLGDVVERHVGHIRYFVLYMASGIAGNVLSLAYKLWQLESVGSIGASGAVYGIVGVLLWILIRNRGRVEGITLRRVLFVMGYSLYLGFNQINVDNMAHIGGVIAGFLFGILLYRKKKEQKIDES